MNNLENKNEPFFQFRKHNFGILEKMYKEYPKAGQLFVFLVKHMNQKTNSLIVSQESIQKILKCSRMSVYRIISYLTDNQYIKIIKTGTSNIYCINADIVWTQSAEGLKFAKFNTSVYVLEDEQDQELKLEIEQNYHKIIEAENRLKNPFNKPSN